MKNQMLAQIVEYGRYKKARVQAIQLGDRAVYRVIDPGRLDGEEILDYRKTYSMDEIYRITSNLNKSIGRENPSRWITFIDEG